MTIFLAANLFPSLAYANNATEYTSNNIRIYSGGNVGHILDTPLLEGWARWNGRDYSNSGYTGNAALQLLSASGQKLFTIQSPSNAKGHIRKFTGETAYTVVGNIFDLNPTYQYHDIHWKIATVDGFIRYYKENILVASFEGDTNAFAGVGVSQVRFGSFESLSTTYIENLIVADEDTRGMLVRSLKPSAAGSLSQMTGTFADVTSTARNDATGITSDTAGQTTLLNLTDPVDTGNLVVKGVFANMRVNKGDTGPQNLNPVLRVGATDYQKPNLPLTNVPTLQSALWYNNPATGLPFTRAELVALQMGIRSQA